MPIATGFKPGSYLAGFVKLGGTELANDARTMSYIRAACLPGWEVPGDCECSAYNEGPYVGVATDPAPWYTISDSRSREFFGLILDDVRLLHPFSRNVTKRAGNGSALGPLRLGHRVVVLEGALVASTCEGMAYGQRWVNEVLRGRLCAAGCSPDDLCVALYCDLPDAPSESALVVDGDDYASTPDNGSLDITGDLELDIDIAPDDWTPAAAVSMMGKWDSAANRSYLFRRGPGGTISLFLSVDGSTIASQASSVSTGFVDGARHSLKATWRQSDGRVQFFTRTPGGAWVQLGADGVIAIASIFSSNAPVVIGGQLSAGVLSNDESGKIYSAVVRDGITEVTNPDFSIQPAGTTEFQDATDKTWTINAGSIVAFPLPNQPAPLAGTRMLRNAGLVDGPIFSDASTPADCTVQRIAFQLAAEMPFLYAEPEVKFDEEVIASGGGTGYTLIDTQDWVADAALRIVLTAGNTDATDLRITGHISLDGTCPDERVAPCIDISIPTLPANSVLTIDSTRQQVSLRDPITLQEGSGLALLEWQGSFPWPEVPACTNLCLTVTNDGAQPVTLTLEEYAREI